MRTTAIAALLPLLSACVISACGGSSDPSDTSTPPPAPPPPPSTPTPAPPPPARPPAPSACALPIERPDGPSTSAPWRLSTVDIKAHPAAICNDGSPAVYMVRRNPATTRWLIWLEGGGQCHDSVTCSDRWKHKPDLMSSTPIINRHAAGKLEFPSSGVFSVDPNENPALHDANLVQVQYCSSDVWSGDHDGNLVLPQNNVARWHFKGRAIALAVLGDLRAREGFGDATEITFGGGSAGSVGIYATIDELSERAPAGARVIGISDGGYQIPYPAYDPVTQRESTVTPTPVELIVQLGQQNWGGRGDASCFAAAADDTARISCRSPEVLTRDGHITTPLLIVNNQYDYNQTNRLGVAISKGSGVVADEPQQAYIRRFATRMREQLAQTEARHAIYANYDVLHVTSQADHSLVTTINGKVQRDAIADWHRDPCHPARNIEAEIAGMPPIAKGR